LGSILGAHFIISASTRIVNIIVVLLISLGLIVALKLDQLKESEREATPGKNSLLPIGVGFVLGLYIGMLGIASALITISTLMILFRLNILQANGTSKMMIFATNLVACVTYAMSDLVNFSLGTLLSIPIAVGSWVGARTALRMESSNMKLVFVGTAAMTIMKLITEII